jgi:hypothetical protein
VCPVDASCNTDRGITKQFHRKDRNRWWVYCAEKKIRIRWWGNWNGALVMER